MQDQRVVLRLGQVVTVCALVLALSRDLCGCSSREDAYRAAMSSDLRYVAAAQAEYHARHGTYAASLDRTGVEPSIAVSIAIHTATAQGWSATASHPGTDQTCHIAVVAGADASQVQPKCGPTAGS